MESKNLKTMDVSGDTIPKLQFRIVTKKENVFFVVVAGRYQGEKYQSEEAMVFDFQIHFTATEMEPEKEEGELKFELTTFEWLSEKPEAIFDGAMCPIPINLDDPDPALESHIFETVTSEFKKDIVKIITEQEIAEEGMIEIPQEKFDQLCSNGARFWLVFSPGSVHENAVEIRGCSNVEDTNAFLKELLETLQFVKGDLWIYVYPNSVDGGSIRVRQDGRKEWDAF